MESSSLALQQTRSIATPTLPTVGEIQSIEAICSIAAQSNFVNSSAPMNNQIQRKADAFFVVMMGRELGIPAMQALKTIYVINGKPSCSGQALLSLMRRAGCEVTIPDPASITDKATVIVKRPGGEAHEYTYTKDMAQAAGLIGKDMWKKYPREMLLWRAISTANRFETPDITGGLYTIEELAPDTEVNAEGDVVGQLTIEAPKPAQIPATVEPPAEPEPEHSADEWINGNVKAWVDKWTGQGMTTDQLMKALGIEGRWGNYKGTVSEADKAVEAYRNAKIIQDDVPATETPADAPKVPDEAELRQTTLAELENQLVEIYHVSKRDRVAGTGKAAGDKWLAKASFFDSTERDQKIEFMLWPEDVSDIAKAGHNFPKVDSEVYIPVVLTIKANAVRVKSVPKKDTTPIVDPESQAAFDAIPSANETVVQPTLGGMPSKLQPV